MNRGPKIALITLGAAGVAGAGYWYYEKRKTTAAASGSSPPGSGSGSSTIAENSLWRVENGRVYIYQNGSMHWICSASLAQSNGISLKNITDVTTLPASVGSNYKGCSGPTSSYTGTPANGQVFELPDGTDYVYQNGKFHMICSSSVATQNNISLSHITKVNALPSSISVGSNVGNCVPAGF